MGLQIITSIRVLRIQKVSTRVRNYSIQFITCIETTIKVYHTTIFYKNFKH